MTENQTPTEPAAAPKKPRIVQNGISRPNLNTRTGRVWAIADKISGELGKPAPRKQVIDTAIAEGINPATAATQYGRWRKFNGLEGRGTTKEPVDGAVTV